MDYKILIVEDAKLIALHLQKILDNAGYNIVGVASNRSEALSVVKKNSPDLILMDIMLSDADDGIETMAEIQKEKEIPVIYLTALTDRNTVERAKETKPYGYIMKPFQAEQVVTLVEMALHKYSAENKLKESEKKFKAAVSSISDSLIFLNEEFKINYINKTAERILETTSEESKGKNFYDVVDLKHFETGEDVSNIWEGGPNSKDIPIRPMYMVQKSNERIPIGDGMISKVFDHKDKLKGVVITFRDITNKLKKKNREEELKKRQLTGMIEGQEKERDRIARELHDGLGQVLNGIKLQLGNLSKNKKGTVEDLKALIDEAIQETSRISENLIPSKLKNFDLGTCLMSLIHHDFSGLKVSFETADIDNSKVDMNIKVNLYRITQELMSNCLKHAQASSLSIQLNGEGKNLILTVEDDGIGFDYNKRKDKLLNGHLGIQNIIDRVNIMNGKIEIDSKIKNGTLVIVDIPYKK